MASQPKGADLSKGTDLSQEQTSLLRPLPPVRIEVPVAGPWSDLVGGLKALGFDVSLAGDEDAPDTVVMVVEGNFPATDANNAFIVVAREQSLRAAKAAIAGGASGYFGAPLICLILYGIIMNF